MKGIKYVLFDLDNTLWDSNKISQMAVNEIFYNNDLDKVIDFQSYIEISDQVNHDLHQLLFRGKINYRQLEIKRWQDILEKIGAPASLDPEEVKIQFLNSRSSQTILIPDAIELLDYLFEKYPMSLLINGRKGWAQQKLENGGLTHYFQNIISGADLDLSKPNQKLFQMAIELINCDPTEVVMIGDDIDGDIHGADSFGLKTIFYNPTGMQHHDVYVSALKEIKLIL